MEKTPTTKRVRTCIGCGVQSDKKALYRIVRSPEGVVSFDKTGRAAGRGAYVCSLECFEKAKKAKKIQRALKVSVEESVSDQVRSDLAAVIAMTGVQ